MAPPITWGQMLAERSKFEKQIRAAAGIYKTPIKPGLHQVGPDAILGVVNNLLQKYPEDEQLLAAQEHLRAEIARVRPPTHTVEALR